MSHGSDYTKYDNLILVNKLSWEQRRALAQFFGSFAMAWLAAGFIVPILDDKLDLVGGINTFFWTGVSLFFMLWLTKGGKK